VVLEQATEGFIRKYMLFFFYLTIAVCLFYLLPGTIPFLLLWIVVGASCAFIDGIHLNRWRNEYESSINESLFICRNENKASVLIAMFVCRSFLLVRLKPRLSIRRPARFSVMPHYWYIEERRIPRLAENGALRPTLSLRPFLASQRKSSTEQQISKGCSTSSDANLLWQLVRQVSDWSSWRCCVFWLDARSEEGEYPLWSLTDERQQPAKRRAARRLR
jgi:hypothetical protein